MPVNHNLNVVHIHIPKTAGTSINNTLFNKNELDIKKVNKRIFYGNWKYKENYFYELDHSTISFLKKECIDYKDLYFKFCYVRNPYSRIVSEYLHCKKHGSRFIKNINSFKDFILELKEKFTFVIDNIELNHHLVSHYIPQYYFIYNNNKCCMDYIGRFENINAHWKQIIKKIKIKIPLKKSTKRYSGKYDWRTFYNKELKDIVYNLYEIDFKTFNYDNNFNIPCEQLDITQSQEIKEEDYYLQE
jgi:hypothetical protein